MTYEILKMINGEESQEPAESLDDAREKAEDVTKNGPAEYAAVMVNGAITFEYEKPHTYKAKNGFTLLNAWTPDGWQIRTPQDIITALLSFPDFETVATEALWQALEDATAERKEYADIKDLADYLTTYYV